ncbi:MAG: peptide chain release factor-like protein [Phycisphaerales bacterium]
MDPDFLDHLDRPVERPTHPASLEAEELLKNCSIVRGRSSGPGGQHRNKVLTHITLTHDPTGTEAQAGERRLAKENQRVAVGRLRLKLALEVRVAVPAGEIRSELWKSRCRKNRITCSPAHRDFPSMLAEALDVIDACGYDMPTAATRLECSSTQLLRLIAEHPPALVMLNKARQDRAMRPLKP